MTYDCRRLSIYQTKLTPPHDCWLPVDACCLPFCCLSLVLLLRYVPFANCLSCLFLAWGCLSYLLLVPCVVVLYLHFVTCLSCLFLDQAACPILLLVPCVVVLYLHFVTCLSCLFLAWGSLSYLLRVPLLLLLLYTSILLLACHVCSLHEAACHLLLVECRCFLFLSSFLSLLLVFIQAGCQRSFAIYV
jgi:hypothetical protein